MDACRKQAAFECGPRPGGTHVRQFDGVGAQPYAPEMERAYVDWVRIENYRCIKSIDLHLTPLHALIGPNDSGKSSILSAIQYRHVAGYWSTGHLIAFDRVHGRFSIATYPSFQPNAPVGVSQNDEAWWIFNSTMLRLDPDALREASPLIPSAQPLWFADARGLGLAAVYDGLLGRDRDAFIAIEHRFRSLFPTVKSLRLVNTTTNAKAIGITLLDGTEVPARDMSEGMLYWLGYAICEYVAPRGILLVEEPENGLHPARIREVMRVLREISTRTQVLIATHSPLVVNEMTADEVTLVTRTSEDGTKVTPMSATKNFAQRSKTYDLGELWLAYADGDHEKELVAKSDPAVKAG